MYEQFFGLSEKPFSIQPDPSFLYWGRTHRLAYAMLEYGVLNHAGISVITGEVGCGKTTLIHRLLDQLSETHSVALISNIQEGRGDLLSWVLMGFGEPFAGKSHVELFSQLQNFFISEYANGRRVVLIIDEAQNLSTDMLEELRLLSNINAGKDQLLQLILVGQPQLKGLLNKPELLQLAQRVGSDFHLTPLNKQEVHAYIDTRLAIAGCRRKVFTDRAIDLLAEESRGVPRVINIIADTALVYAFSAEELVVGVETIRNVIRDKTEFGVFGLASDASAAPPLEPARNGGIDSFAGSGDPEHPAKDNKGAEEKESDHDDREEAAPYAPVEETPAPASKPASPPASPSAPPPAPPREEKTPGHAPLRAVPVADLKTKIAASPASEPAQPEGVQKQPVREESSVTGVVVVARDKKSSPEAAIRSAGDGRAIVFVATGAASEAISIARKAGAVVVEGADRALSTGGRARNAGYRQLKKIAPHVKYIQFLDAEGALDPDWISSAEKFMNRRPEVSVVEGYLRSHRNSKLQFPTIREQQRAEVDGEIQCVMGGSALVRAENFEAVGGFRGDLITSETEDLCVRLRRRGSRVWRTDSTMAMFRQTSRANSNWWSQRIKRGFDNAYCASLHGGPPDRLGVYDTALAVFWGFLFPIGVLAAALIGGVASTLFWPLTSPVTVAATVLGIGVLVTVLRFVASVFRRGLFKPSAWRAALIAVLGSFPEFFGACKFWLSGRS